MILGGLAEWPMLWMMMVEERSVGGGDREEGSFGPSKGVSTSSRVKRPEVHMRARILGDHNGFNTLAM